MKEMLYTAYNKSVMSQASIYCWYNEFKSGMKSMKLMGRCGASTTALTKQTINTGATIIFDDPRLTLRQHALLLDISIGSAHTFLST